MQKIRQLNAFGHNSSRDKFYILEKTPDNLVTVFIHTHMIAKVMSQAANAYHQYKVATEAWNKSVTTVMAAPAKTSTQQRCDDNDEQDDNAIINEHEATTIVDATLRLS